MQLLKRRRHASIRMQVLAIAVVPALAITFLMVFVVYQGNVLRGDQTLAQQGELLAAQLASTLEYALSTGAADEIPATIETTAKPAAEVLQTEIKRVAVFAKNDRLLYSSPPIKGSDIPESNFFISQMLNMDELKTFTGSIYLDPLGLSTEPSQTRRYLGKVTVTISTAPIGAKYFQQFLMDMGLILLIFGNVLFFAHLTGRRLSHAIREAAQAIQCIKAGDLSIRLRKTESSEIGTLQEGVNLAVEAIIQGKEALERTLAKVRAEHEIALSQLRIQTEAAERANQAKSMFLAKVSHEMRTPLYSIQGLAEQLLKTPRNTNDAHCVHNILKASRTLYHTISDILDFTQLEGGKYQPMLKSFELWEEIEANIETVGMLAYEQGLYLDVIVGQEVPQKVLGDPKGFRTVVANLLSNAIKFTQQGGICIRLELESHSLNAMALIRLEVQDTGCGIPRNRLAAIFEPFEQIEGGLNRRYEGSGLGLAIVKTYCETMAGRITVESEPGKGSIFTAWLPVTPASTSDDLSHKTEFSQLQVLVVDERLSFCESVRSRLGNLGVDVAQHCCPLREFMVLTSPSRRFDLVIVRDLSHCHGHALTETVVRLRAWAQHVVSLEIRSDNGQSQRLLDSGVAAVLGASTSRSSLAAALRMLQTENAVESKDSDFSNFEESSVHRDELEGKQVLVVEDFEINREIMARQLKNHGLRVIEASDGDEAVVLALRPDIDLILMDIQMPGKDGITAIKEIREMPSGARIPILAFTASADKPTHRKVIAAGADAVLAKPISEAELIGAIQQRLVFSR